MVEFSSVGVVQPCGATVHCGTHHVPVPSHNPLLVSPWSFPRQDLQGFVLYSIVHNLKKKCQFTIMLSSKTMLDFPQPSYSYSVVFHQCLVGSSTLCAQENIEFQCPRPFLVLSSDQLLSFPNFGFSTFYSNLEK